MIELENVITKMNTLRMTNMAKKLTDMYQEPNFGLMTSREVLDKLFECECTTRQARKINRMLNKAHLKYPAASFDDSLNDTDRNINVNEINRLATCGWINDKKNLIVTGKAGTGKTYNSCALAVCAIEKGKHVLYTKASHMINELNDCQFHGNYANSLRRYTDIDLLVIDDFGLMSLDISKCLQLFEVLDAREGSGSTLVISQLPVKNWYETFQNNVYADACMSRLVNNAYRLEFSGRDMRKPPM